jgi:hypothetical protein
MNSLFLDPTQFLLSTATNIAWRSTEPATSCTLLTNVVSSVPTSTAEGAAETWTLNATVFQTKLASLSSFSVVVAPKPGGMSTFSSFLLSFYASDFFSDG